MKDHDEIERVRELIDASWQADSTNREDAYQDLRFLAGDQWPERVRQDREAQNRPCLTVNRLPQFVHQVANAIRQNPPAIKTLPAGGEATVELSQIFTDLLRHIQYRSNAVHVYSSAAYYAVACGIGHFRIVTDYVDDNGFDQEILIKRIYDPLSVFWDADAGEPDRSDAHHCVVSELMTKEAFERRYPDANPASFDIPGTLDQQTGLFWQHKDAVRVAELWERVPFERTMARLETGETVDVTGLGQSELMRLGVLAVRKVKSHKIQQTIMSGTEILSGPNDWAGRYIPIFPVIGQEITLDDQTIRHGLIRFARDPQHLYNYWRSAAAELIALAPRSPFLATPAMITKYKSQWNTLNTVSRPYLLYDPDPDAPNQRPMREPPPDLPQAFWQEGAMTSDEMKATTGVYDAALGARSNETSGVAIRAREAQGDISTLHYQDNLLATLHHLGRALVDLVPKIYDTHRVMRVMNEDGLTQREIAINIPAMDVDGHTVLLNDLNQGTYDVRVKIGPSFTTRRVEAANAMVEFVKAVPQAMPLIGDLIAHNFEWDGAEEIASRLKKLLPPGFQEPGPDGQPAPMSQEMMRQQAMEEQELARRTALTEAELELKRGKAMEAQARGMKAQAEAMAVGRGPQPKDSGSSPEKEALELAMAQSLLRERQARAARAEVDLVGRMIENQRNTARSPYDRHK